VAHREILRPVPNESRMVIDWSAFFAAESTPAPSLRWLSEIQREETWFTLPAGTSPNLDIAAIRGRITGRNRPL
jgi:hypothetical protein